MAKRGSRKSKKGLRRVEFRTNRQQPARRKDWTLPPEDEIRLDLLTTPQESVRAKGELSRKRTVQDPAELLADGRHHEGTVVRVSGQYVEVDDGRCVLTCTVRRVVRTQAIRDRKPIVVGDRVLFTRVSEGTGDRDEGVVEYVFPRRTSLARSDGRRTHVIAANVDQALIVSSIAEPMLKQHLIDRYLVAAHAGGLEAIVCINKADLAPLEIIEEYLEIYRKIGYRALATSACDGRGIDQLRNMLVGRATLLAGQSGVGKSSLLNAIQPGLNLRTAPVSEATEKGRHTTTTAVWLKLECGGSVVDTPGIRALDVAMVPLNELEMHFVEFVDLVPHCRFPDCVHLHEEGCAVRAAVEDGRVDPDRYASYRELFLELSQHQASRYA